VVKAALCKGFKINIAMDRPLCTACNRKLAAINYRKGNRTHYRKRCDSCERKNRKMRVPKPRWQQSGFKKKLECDRCGFRAVSGAQILVYHLDGNLNNSNLTNLRNVCLNCTVEITRLDLPWQVGDLSED
jgi:hypothetical protein